jgi:predicted lysophospholipase L1 biosynthesis ABC-type transport system permease subunit
VLGASRRQVRLAIVRQCRWAVAGGGAAGMVLSLLAGRLLRRYLFGLSPLDITSFAITGLVLVAAALSIRT